MTPEGEPEDDEDRRLRELLDEVDTEARKRTEALWELEGDTNDLAAAARELGADAPGREAMVAEVEKRRNEIQELWMEVDRMWVEVDRINDLLRARSNVPFHPVNVFDPHRTTKRKILITPEVQAKNDEYQRRGEVMNELRMKLMAHRMALADLEAKGSGEIGASAEMEKHRESVKEAVNELEAEIKRLTEIDAPGCGETTWLMENWREILTFEDQKQYLDMVKKKRDLVLERENLSLTPEQSAKAWRVMGIIDGLEEKWHQHEGEIEDLELFSRKASTSDEVEKHQEAIQDLKAEIERLWESRYA